MIARYPSLSARNIGAPTCGWVASASSGRSTSAGSAPPGPMSRIASSLNVPCMSPWRRSIALAGVAGRSQVS